MVRRILYLFIILLLSASAAAAQNDYKITYTIDVNNEGTAFWNVEYRTQLITKEDFNSFENYTSDLNSIHLIEFKNLMQNSVLEAANATSRKMVAGGFTGSAKIQSAPTGTFGIVQYSFTWTDFAEISNGNIRIGDVFVGGLYLSKDNTLIIQYPSGFAVEHASPRPDEARDGLIWYGLRSFNPGEPEVSLLKTSTEWMPYLIAILIISILSGSFIYLHLRKSPPGVITENEMMNLEDRIVKLLKDSGGSMYQSEIGKKLDLPKSTVSSALNGLRNKNIIQKIRKGRENLIRLV
ncbi:MAG: hypothetical protein OIN88_07510 [Candidatus Methanoperedens sp.]|nr:hypothetical protein [Candidatus Methanoperedens sp.]